MKTKETDAPMASANPGFRRKTGRKRVLSRKVYHEDYVCDETVTDRSNHPNTKAKMVGENVGYDLSPRKRRLAMAAFVKVRNIGRYLRGQRCVKAKDVPPTPPKTSAKKDSPLKSRVLAFVQDKLKMHRGQEKKAKGKSLSTSSGEWKVEPSPEKVHSALPPSSGKSVMQTSKLPHNSPPLDKVVSSRSCSTAAEHTPVKKAPLEAAQSRGHQEMTWGLEVDENFLLPPPVSHWAPPSPIPGPSEQGCLTPISKILASNPTIGIHQSEPKNMDIYSPPNFSLVDMYLKSVPEPQKWICNTSEVTSAYDEYCPPAVPYYDAHFLDLSDQRTGAAPVPVQDDFLHALTSNNMKNWEATDVTPRDPQDICGMEVEVVGPTEATEEDNSEDKREPSSKLKIKICPDCGDYFIDNFARHLARKHDHANTIFHKLKSEYGNEVAKEVCLNKGRNAFNTKILSGELKTGEFVKVCGRDFEIDGPIARRAGESQSTTVVCQYCEALVSTRNLSRHHKENKVCITITGGVAASKPPTTRLVQKKDKSIVKIKELTKSIQDVERRLACSSDIEVLSYLDSQTPGSVENQQDQNNFLRRANIVAETVVELKKSVGLDAGDEINWLEFFKPVMMTTILDCIHTLCDFVEKDDGVEEHFRKPDKVKQMVPRLKEFLEHILDTHAENGTPRDDLADIKLLLEMMKRPSGKFHKKTTGLVKVQKRRNPSAPRKPPSSADVTMTLHGLYVMAVTYLNMMKELWNRYDESDPMDVRLIRRIHKGLAETTAILGILYNGKRKFEMLKLKKIDYNMALKNVQNEDLLSHFSAAQREMSQELTCVLTQGKCFKQVPIILTPWMNELIGWVLKTSTAAGVSPNNPFVFGSPIPLAKSQFFKYYQCKDVLKDVKTIVELSDPNSMSTGGARCHVAVITALCKLTDGDVSLVQKFMSHSAIIHELHYKIIKADVFKSNIGALLEARMNNTIGDFSEMSLKEMVEDRHKKKNKK